MLSTSVVNRTEATVCWSIPSVPSSLVPVASYESKQDIFFTLTHCLKSLSWKISGNVTRTGVNVSCDVVIPPPAGYAK